MCTFKKCKDRGQEEGGVRGENRAGGGEWTGGGISHGERDIRPLLTKMKGYFNWVSDSWLILFSILIPYNVHNQNKYTHGEEAVNRKQ